MARAIQRGAELPDEIRIPLEEKLMLAYDAMISSKQHFNEVLKEVYQAGLSANYMANFIPESRGTIANWITRGGQETLWDVATGKEIK